MPTSLSYTFVEYVNRCAFKYLLHILAIWLWMHYFISINSVSHIKIGDRVFFCLFICFLPLLVSTDPILFLSLSPWKLNPRFALLRCFAGGISFGLNLLVGLASNQRREGPGCPVLSVLQCCIVGYSFVSSCLISLPRPSAACLQLSQCAENTIPSPCFFSPRGENGFLLLLFSGYLNIP